MSQPPRWHPRSLPLPQAAELAHGPTNSSSIRMPRRSPNLCTEPVAPVFPPITITYLLIFVLELPDDGRLCKCALVVLVGFPHILLAFEATLSGHRLQVAATSGATQTCPGVSGSLSESLEPGISKSEEGMVRGIKRGARWEEIVNR
jgi:hypothetical protein